MKEQIRAGIIGGAGYTGRGDDPFVDQASERKYPVYS